MNLRFDSGLRGLYLDTCRINIKIGKRKFLGKGGKMVKILRSVLFLCPIVFVMSGCAAQHHMEGGHASKEANVIKNSVVLQPSETHEECVTLKNGQELVYQFSSNKPVDFNIHHHTEHDIQYPVNHKGVTEYGGIFDPEKENFNLEQEEYFCMMWQNRDTGLVRISYECSVKEK